MRRLAVLAALLVALLAAAPAARADFGIAPGSFQLSALDAGGQPELRAGAHPDRLITRFAFNTLPDGVSADGDVKDVAIDMPAGFVGDVGAVPACAREDFDQNTCPATSQVGIMQVTFAGFPPFQFPVYDVAPEQGEFAELGFFAVILPARLAISLRAESDYGTRIELRDLPENLPLVAGQLELWGVPADHQSGTGIPRRAFLTNPTRCDATAPTTALHARSWQDPQHWVDATTAATAGPLTGCAGLAFDPGLGLSLEQPVADTPTGVSIDVAVPQSEDPDGLAASQVRDLAITLPAGLTLSPSVAEGLAACDDDQFGSGTPRPPACPPASQLGTAQLTTPLLADPLEGPIYLGRPLPGNPYRLFVDAGGSGITLRVAGTLRPDPLTGQLYILLSGLPAVPISHMTLRFKGGPRAPLATPPGCGDGAASASLSPYRGGAPAQAFALVDVARDPLGPCALSAPFAPRFLAGSSPALAGAGSAFSMTVRRRDGEQPLDRLHVTLPAGLTARLAGVPRCGAGQAARAACPSASRVGSVGIEAGAGASPLPLTGAAYLTGRHGDAPFGLALVLHAQAGPLDLGTVVIRAGLRVDPADARFTIDTDPLPQILAGIPLRLRTLAVAIDRPGLMVNPTSCGRARVTATIDALDGTSASGASPYLIAGCRRLRFAPAVAVGLGGRARLRRGGRPTLTIALRERGGQANLRAARIALPSAVRLDASAVATLCTHDQALDGRCPRGSIVGSARVRTPLLPAPLSGPIAVVVPLRGTQPELWATVAGMGVRLTVHATTAGGGGAPLTTELDGLPDVQLSELRLTLRGGRRGALSLARSLCVGGRPRRVVVGAVLRGQNGARRAARVRVRTGPAC
jgi:hypothetical protein